jgi:hypothetical protein
MKETLKNTDSGSKCYVPRISLGSGFAPVVGVKPEGILLIALTGIERVERQFRSVQLSLSV